MIHLSTGKIRWKLFNFANPKNRMRFPYQPPEFVIYKQHMICAKGLTLAACTQMYLQDVPLAKNYFQLQWVLLNQSPQPAVQMIYYLWLWKILYMFKYQTWGHFTTFAWKFLSIKIFAGLISRWMYTGTVCSWIYSRPLAESRAICTLVGHGSGSLSGKIDDVT